MKQSSSSTHFGGIPLDTNTLAGQWMTFSHMANHYRKLLNVKPRVNTGLVGPGGGSTVNLSSINSKMIQSSKSGKKKRQTSSTNNIQTCNSSTIYNHHQQQQHSREERRNSLMYSSHPDHLNTLVGNDGGGGSGHAKPATRNNHIELTIKSPMKNGRSKKKALTSHYPEYQVVFGPASLQSSSDAFMSDDTGSSVTSHHHHHHNDTHHHRKPPSEVQAPIGVTEKIRRFLNHIHQLDLTSSPNSKKSSGKRVTTNSSPALVATSVASKTKERPVTVNSTAVVSSSRNERHQTRHSKCFLPYEPPSPKTPRKSVSSAVSKLGSPRLEVDHQFSQSAHHFSHHQHQKLSPRLARNKFTGSGGDLHTAMIPEKDISSSGHNKRPGKSRKRAESIASIGTICGSEELTPEDFPVTIKDICATLESGGDDLLLQRIIADNRHLTNHSISKKSPRKALHEKDHNHRTSKESRNNQRLVKSTSMASLVPSSSHDGSGNFAKSNHHLHHHHRHHHLTQEEGVVIEGNSTTPHATNKDSSRDSAYGFSSGESRITTRESTPEKKCLTDGAFNLSSGKGHVNFEDMPCKDKSSFPLDKRFSKSSKENHRHYRLKDKEGPIEYDESISRRMKATSTNDLRKRDPKDKYITFLTELTNDVVRKGIYTNKGLKALFKSHTEQNKQLNPEKLAEMVERLRMDLGIPKDDSLDKIEFGYGSISDASTFFYTPSTPTRDKLSTESVILTAKTAVSSGTLISAATTVTSAPMLLTSNHSSPHPSSPSPTTIIPAGAMMLPSAGEMEGVTGTACTSTTTGFSSSGGPNTSSNRSSTTGEGSGAGDLISVPDSEDIYSVNKLIDDHEDDDDDFEVDVEDDEDEGNISNNNDEVEDELSLSDTEVSQYLKVAGLDNGTMQSVMGLLKN